MLGKKIISVIAIAQIFISYVSRWCLVTKNGFPDTLWNEPSHCLPKIEFHQKYRKNIVQLMYDTLILHFPNFR